MFENGFNEYNTWTDLFSVREKSLGSFQKDFFSACVDQVGYSFAFIIESCSLFGLFFYLGLGMQGH